MEKGGTMLRRFLVVAAVSGWPLAVGLTPAHAGGGCAEVTSGKSQAVDLKGFCVFPTLIRVPVGTAVTFTNRDAVEHVIVGAGMAWGSDGTMQQGDSFSTRFERDGVYPFQCYLHPGMSGAVLVGDANGRGPATSFGITLPPSSEAPRAAAAAADRSDARGAEGDRTPWTTIAMSVLAGALIAVGAGGWFVRSRRSRPAPPAAA
jgi:plastocyanin